MEIFSRAVDWVVTRTVNEEISREAARLTSVLRSWENLSGDIFSVILKYFHSKSDSENLRNLRLVCRNWRRHVETHLEVLTLTLPPSLDLFPFLTSFSNLRSLSLQCTFDQVYFDPFLLLKSTRKLIHLRKLDLRNSKGRLNSGIEFLNHLKQLMELNIDGDSLKAMRLRQVKIPDLKRLTLQNCVSFTNEDYQYLAQFSTLQCLKLINFSSFWEHGNSFLTSMNNLEELAIMNFTNTEVKSNFSCLEKVSSELKQLVIQEAEITMGQIRSLGSFPFVHKLALYGIGEISASFFHSIAQKFPVLTHMKLGCFLNTIVDQEFAQIINLPVLERLEIINCPNLDPMVLKCAFKKEINLVHEPCPDTMLHEKIKTLDIYQLEEFLRSCQHHQISDLPLFGEYFDPSVLTELSGKQRYDLVRLLVSYGADADYGNPFLAHDSCHCYDCSTPLHFAVHKGDQKGVIDLLNLGARVNAHCSEDCRVPLHLAASTGNVELTRILLTAGGEVNALDSLFRTPLHAAVSWGSTEVIAELIHHGADGSLVDHELLSPMCYAARLSDTELMGFLIKEGLGINEGMKYDLPTPLHVAVKRGGHKMVKFLLENGARPEAKDVSGSTTPLFVAARHRKRLLLATLLKYIERDEEILNNRDETGNTILHYSAMYGWMDIVEILIEMGAEVNATDPKGFTALYYADLHRHLNIVSRLTKEGGLARWITQPKTYKRQQRFRLMKSYAF